MLKWTCRWLLAVNVGFLAALPASGQDFVFGANQISAEISQVVPPTTASFSLFNRSSLNDATVFTIRAGLLQALQSRGWKLGKPEGNEVAIAVTLGENFRNYVWTAEITKAASREVRIVEVMKGISGRLPTENHITLTRYLLISSENPLLDATLPEGKVGEGAHLLALTASTIQLFQLQSGQWRPLQTQPLGRSPLSTRDMRGRISSNQSGGFDAYLPGVHCIGTATSSLNFTCRQSDDPWPLADDRQSLAFYAPSRNYFNGVLSSPNGQSGTVNAFYSAAVLSDRVAFTNLDGRTSVVQAGKSVPIPEKWGSSIAAIQSSCRTDLALVSGAGDFQTTDSLSAYEVANSEFRPASEPLQFAGPIMNLKTAADHQQAIAIAATPYGRYEAYLLTARCGT